MQQPFLTALILLSLVWFVQFASGRSPFSRLTAWLPIPFWCYSLPMLLSAVQVLPKSSPLYDTFSLYLLPLCLGLMLLDTDFPSLFKMGGQATYVMLIGSFGIMSGMGLGMLLWKKWLPENGWMALGALAGSWTGGSLNMLSVKEALRMPDSLLASIIIVDTVVAYGWMAFLLTGAGQTQADETAPETSKAKNRHLDLGIILACAVAITWVASLIRHSMWRIVFTTTASLVLSLTPISQMARHSQSSRLGQLLLLVLLTSMGARVDVGAFRQAPIFLAAGVTAVAWHGLLLITAGRFLKVPRGILATASQANIGGVVSAPLVGAAYEKSLVTLGLLMAILGNVIGTYAGLMTSTICRWIQLK